MAFEQHVIHRLAQIVFINAAAGGGVALWIEVYQQHPAFSGGEARGQIDAGRGFPHPAFLVCDRKYFGHYSSTPIMTKCRLASIPGTLRGMTSCTLICGGSLPISSWG
jgi:hypothetical protein